MTRHRETSPRPLTLPFSCLHLLVLLLLPSCGPLTAELSIWSVYLPPGSGGAETDIDFDQASKDGHHYHYHQHHHSPASQRRRQTDRQTDTPASVATCHLHLHAAHQTQGTPMHWTHGLALLARPGEPCIPSRSLPGRLHTLDGH